MRVGGFESWISLLKISRDINELQDPCTTKKQGYPSVFKSAGIALKSAGIGLFFLSRRFFSRRFKPPGNECGNRANGPVPALLKALGKAYALCQRFQKRWYRPFKLYWYMTYTSAFESAGIGRTYSSVLNSAGIGLESI